MISDINSQHILNNLNFFSFLTFYFSHRYHIINVSTRSDNLFDIQYMYAYCFKYVLVYRELFFLSVRYCLPTTNSDSQIYFIAEIGVNHNGDMALAEEMIDQAIKSGANAVKFQTFTAEKLVSDGTPKVKYQRVQLPEETHFSMIKNLELSKENHLRLSPR